MRMRTRAMDYCIPFANVSSCDPILTRFVAPHPGSSLLTRSLKSTFEVLVVVVAPYYPRLGDAF